MNVLQHTRNERNACLKQNRPDRSYRDSLKTQSDVILTGKIVKILKLLKPLKFFHFKGCFNYFSVSARHFNPSARSEKQLSKFINTNGVLICEKEGKNASIQPFLFQTPDRMLNFASV